MYKNNVFYVWAYFKINFSRPKKGRSWDFSADSDSRPSNYVYYYEKIKLYK